MGLRRPADSGASGDAAAGPPCLSLPSCLAALAPDVMVPSCLPEPCPSDRTRDSPLGQLFLPKLGQPMGAGVRSRATNEQGAPDTGSALSIWSSQCRGSGGRQRGAHKGLRGPRWMGRRDFIPWGQKKCFARGQRGAHKGLKAMGQTMEKGAAFHSIRSKEMVC